MGVEKNSGHCGRDFIAGLLSGFSSGPLAIEWKKEH